MVKLRDISYFAKFSDEDIEQIEKFSAIKHYNQGDIIYYEKEEPEYLFLLLEGRVDIYKTNSKGKQLFIHRVKNVDFLGEIAIFKKIPYPTTAECVTNCKVLRIDYLALEKNFCNKLFFCNTLVESLYDRIVILMNAIDNSFLSSEERVAKFILKNSEDFAFNTYTDVSKKLNITPETLSRIISKFKKRGLIEISDDHVVKILSKDELESIGE